MNDIEVIVVLSCASIPEGEVPYRGKFSHGAKFRGICG